MRFSSTDPDSGVFDSELGVKQEQVEALQPIFLKVSWELNPPAVNPPTLYTCPLSAGRLDRRLSRDGISPAKLAYPKFRWHVDLNHGLIWILLNPARGLLRSICASVRVCVCVCLSVCLSVNNIAQKVFNKSTSYLVEAFPLTQGWSDSILRNIAPG